MTFLILGAFGLLTGITASLFGFGGGFIIVPLLYHILGTNNPNSMHVAIATSTSIMIINSLNATYKHHKTKNIMWNLVFPLVFYIAFGAVIGVYVAKFMSNAIIKLTFVVYMGYTIYDCISNKQFISHNATNITSMNKHLNIIVGIIIGFIATVLGVGGSVMTVPLMRKLGAKMKNAVAIANPLSLPVAFVGAVGYTISAYIQNINLGSNYVGFIYLPAFLFLVIGGFIGVPIGSKLTKKISDTIHAKVYILLLFLVLIAMLV